MDDEILLRQYVTNQDASAFEELTRRYSNLVRGVCFRLMGNSHDAEEVTQECFFELARHAADVHTSLGGWLRRTATSRSLNALRSRTRRKVRERVVGRDANSVVFSVDPTGVDLQRMIQGALKELPDELRVPMVLHFVDGRSQRDVAVELGINQSTVSRRMQDALRQMRDKLTQAGYAATAPGIMLLMQKPAAASTTENLLSDAANAGTAAKLAGSMTLLNSFKWVVAMLLPILSFLCFDGWISLLVTAVVAQFVGRNRPIWASQILSRFGWKELYRQPTFCLARWTWTTAPDGWRSQVCTSLLWSVAFIGLSALFGFGSNHVPWGTVVLGLVLATALSAHAIRLWNRATLCQALPATDAASISKSVMGSVESNRESADADVSWTWVDAVQLTLIGLAGLGIAIPILFRSPFGIAVPSLCALISGGMLVAGLRLGFRFLSDKRSDLNQYEFASDVDSPGTLTIMGIGAALVTALSTWIVWNPGSVQRLSLSLAAVQTLMLGWIVYRIAAAHQIRSSHLVRRIVVAMLVVCFMLNSGRCLANWF